MYPHVCNEKIYEPKSNKNVIFLNLIQIFYFKIVNKRS